MRRALLAAGVIALAGLPGAIAPGPASATPSRQTAKQLSKAPIAQRPAWRTQVLDPPGPYVRPRAVFVEGDAAAVDDPQALTRPGGVTTIRATGAGAPRLVLDLGVETGGIVEATVTAGSGATVRLAYSEARRVLTPIGDTAENSLGDNDEPYARYDTFAGAAGTTFASPATRGGERWVLLQLDGPGTVSLRDVGVRVQHLRPALGDHRGRFLSSDPVLNRAWWASAYTFDVSTAGDTQVVMDGAKRDRVVFAGDLGMAELVGLNTVAQGPRVIRNSLRLLSCQPELLVSLATYSNTDVACPDDPAAASPLGPLPKVPDLTHSAPSPLAILQGQLALPSGEYVAWYVQAAATYYRYTADQDYLRKLLPVLRRCIRFLGALEQGGLYSAPLDYTWRASLTTGVSPYTNSLYYGALRGLAQLEREVGHDRAAGDALDAHAEAVRRALVARFGDAATGALLADPQGSPGVHLQDANVMAPWVGVLRGDAAGRALDYVRGAMATTYGTKTFDRDGATAFGPQFVSPFMTAWEVLARLQRGDTAIALDLLRRLWGHMVATDPQSTTWEKVALDGDVQPNQPRKPGEPTTRDEGEGYVSLAHAWSGGPVPALSGYVLGARPAEAGFRTWVVAPQPGDLRWAQGQVPTPSGVLVSRWARGAKDRTFRLTVRAPAGTSGTVAVPLLGADRRIARDGRLVWARGRAAGGARAERQGDAVRFEQGAGRHTYAWVARR
jgi:hypothetical protein